jgi:outer membrane protein TolC
MTTDTDTPVPAAQAFLRAQRVLLDTWDAWVRFEASTETLEAAREACRVADEALRVERERIDREEGKKV